MNCTTALIGCGRIGFLLEDDPLRTKPCTHYGGAKKAKLTITHACDINKERLSQFAQKAKLPIEHCYTDFQALFEREQPECVIIASWTQTHATIGIQAAHHGAKVIVCEKPIAQDIASAKLLLEACSAHNTTLIINHERRYDYRYNFVKKLIEKGSIGAITSVHGFVFTPSRAHIPQSGGGILLHDGTHLIDTVHYLFGTIAQLQGHTKQYSPQSLYEDYALSHCLTHSGIHVILEAGGYRDYFLFELRIYGTGGAIVIGNGYLHVYTPEKSQFYTGFNDLVAKHAHPKGKPDYFVQLYKEAKQCLKHPKPVTSSGTDGYRALEVIHAIYHSASQGGKTITLPLDCTSNDSVCF